MERLVCSSSKPIPGKLGRYSTRLPPPEFARGVEILSISSSSSPATSFPLLARRSPNGPCFLPRKALQGWPLASADTGHGSDPKVHLVDRVSQNWCAVKKVINGGLAAMLLPLVITCLHAAIAPPSLASFSATSSSGGPSAGVVAAGQRFLRSTLVYSAWTGFFAGCLHTLSGPDHLAALAPLSIGRTRLESAAVGALWGCGHDAGQVLFGLVFLLLKDRLHIEVIRTWGSIVVGLTLLVIGVLGIKEAVEASEVSVSLETGIGAHEQALLIPAKEKKKIGLATFATGIVHGLQPDALMMILPALALPSRLAGAAFLIMFLVGTVFAMGSYTVFIGSCSQALKERIPRITEKLTWASSMVAIGLGVAILISQYLGISLY